MNPLRRQSLSRLVAPALLLLTFLPHLAHADRIAGSGTSVSESRQVADFQAIALTGHIDLVVRQGATQSVQVSADDNLVHLLETVVERTTRGETLKVRWQRGSGHIQPHSKALVTVVVPKLTALSAAGAGDMRVEQFNAPEFKLSLAGSGDAKLMGLTAGELGISLSGSGEVGGTGTASKVKIKIAGSGDVRLHELAADDVSVSIAGSGDAAVNASKSLEVRIAGSGDVTYTGAAEVKSRVAGSGSVTRR